MKSSVFVPLLLLALNTMASPLIGKATAVEYRRRDNWPESPDCGTGSERMYCTPASPNNTTIESNPVPPSSAGAELKDVSPNNTTTESNPASPSDQMSTQPRGARGRGPSVRALANLGNCLLRGLWLDLLSQIQFRKCRKRQECQQTWRNFNQITTRFVLDEGPRPLAPIGSVDHWTGRGFFVFEGPRSRLEREPSVPPSTCEMELVPNGSGIARLST